MTIKLFPLNNTDYTADDMATYFSTRTNGVFSANGELATTSNSNMTVTVSTGRAWLNVSKFKGLMFCLKENKVLTVEQADGILNRIDRVVVRYDIINNNGAILIKKGTPSSTPVAPALVRNETEYYELAIADILVSKGVTSITASAITDQRLNTNLCGVMADGVTHIPTDVLENQFKEWFKNLQNQLDSNQATNLQNQIDVLKENKVSKTEKTTIETDASVPVTLYRNNATGNCSLGFKSTAYDRFLGIDTAGNLRYGNSADQLTNGKIVLLQNEDIVVKNVKAKEVMAEHSQGTSNLTLSFSTDNVPRLRIGGSGTGTGNGFVIQTVNDRALFRVFEYGTIVPPTDNGATLGQSGQKWTSVFAVNGAIQTSDSSYKEDITRLNDARTKMANEETTILEFMRDMPIYQYNYKNNEVGSYQTGFLADEVIKINEFLASRFIYQCEDGAFATSTQSYVANLHLAFQEEVKKREQLENEVNELKVLVNQLLNK